MLDLHTAPRVRRSWTRDKKLLGLTENTMRALIILVLGLGVAGCKEVPMLPFLTTHKIDIQQGNYVTQDMISRLKPGMTRSQVRFLMGTPLIVDPFHSDRWDYVYTFQKAGTMKEQRRIVVIFDSDKLLRIEGDVVPAQTAAAQQGAAGGAAGSGAAPAAGTKAQETPKEEKGFFGRMWDRLGF
jgi:outer membrane protein assembly factor BamE